MDISLKAYIPPKKGESNKANAFHIWDSVWHLAQQVLLVLVALIVKGNVFFRLTSTRCSVSVMHQSTC